MKAYTSAILLAALSATLLACGGGGDGYTVAQGELAPWEWETGVCSFDSDAAQAQALRDGADCWRAVYVGNKGAGPWPPVSWPSTPVLWRAR